MNIPEVVALLESKGVARTESAIKFIASKHGLYNEGNSPRPGLDPKKVKQYVDVASSSLRVAEIARTMGVTYSKVNYYILKHRITTVKLYGIALFRNKKDAEYVKSFL